MRIGKINAFIAIVIMVALSFLCACGGDDSETSGDGDDFEAEAEDGDSDSEDVNGDNDGDSDLENIEKDEDAHGAEEDEYDRYGSDDIDSVLLITLGLDLSQGPYFLDDEENIPLHVENISNLAFDMAMDFRVICPALHYDRTIIPLPSVPIEALSYIDLELPLRSHHLLADENCFPCQIIPIAHIYQEAYPYEDIVSGQSFFVDPTQSPMIVYTEKQYREWMEDSGIGGIPQACP